MEYVDRVFEGDEVSLDGNSFTRCTFRDVKFVYAGGGVDIAECRMESFSFRFDGDLAQGLFTLYQLFGRKGMLEIIGNMTDPDAVDGPIQLG